MSSIINQIMDKCRDEINKDECDSLIKKDILNPLINYMGKKMMPYIWFSIFMLTLAISIIVVCCLCIYMKYCNNHTIH